MTQADIAAEPEAARSIVIERLIDAPRELVFKAFTTAEHLAHWWGPTGFSITTFAFEFKVGGVWRFVMHGPDRRDYQNRIVFDEIVPPERIVYRHDGGEDVEPVRFSQTVIFEDVGGRTRMTWWGVFPSATERDRVIKEYGAGEGLVQTMARLGDYVAAQG